MSFRMDLAFLGAGTTSVDSVGNAFVCLSIGSWAAASPLVGVRPLGGRCSGPLSAQSPDGIAMICMNGVWAMGDDIPR
jgi:hypothetical protein